MKITPTKYDLRDWAKLVPGHGDLLFFDKRHSSLMKSIGAPVLTADQVRAQSVSIWNLQARSWYGYALNNASYAVYLPSGVLDQLSRSNVKKIGEIQIKLGVPSLIETIDLPDEVRDTCLKIGKYSWITSKVFSAFKDNRTRAKVMRAWIKQNDVHLYDSQSWTDLPANAKRTLESIGLSKFLNTYAEYSGPNCFATVAAAIAAKPGLADQWLYWLPLKLFLKEQGYRIIKASPPQARDILVFIKGGVAIHAAVYLGENLYFEKPGQDFYEPWRVEHFDHWKAEWAGCKLSIFRKP
ncbi:MAG: hypothetical protein EOP05_00725 [Proteobacteria bacterium]|nr:MAG: hypothetical protein EOP05_00725 [Pseudomonadota bacterium]